MSDTAPPIKPPTLPGEVCPTCKHKKEWKGDKPGAMSGGMKFRPLAVKRGTGRPRVRPKDKRYVEFY